LIAIMTLALPQSTDITVAGTNAGQRAKQAL
jgi:hypothetical protein